MIQGRSLLVLVAVVLIGMAGAVASAVSQHENAHLQAGPPSGGAPTPAPGQPLRGEPVPVLDYKVISAPPSPRLRASYVAPSEFSQQMRALAARGYHGVTLDQVFDHWQHGSPLPPKPIVVSFDDGWQSQFTNAHPVLKGLRWPGVLNLASGLLDQSGSLSSNQVRALVTDGWELDSESISRPDLTRLDPARAQREVAQSRISLQRSLRVPVNFFAYPRGLYNPAAIAAVTQAGYRGASTEQLGLARPQAPFTLARIPVQGGDGVAGLEQKLAQASR